MKVNNTQKGNNGMKPNVRLLVNIVKRLLREVELADSPGSDTQWCLKWKLTEWFKCKYGFGFERIGLVTVSVDKAWRNGIIDFKLEFGSAPYTCRFVNNALCDEIRERAMACYECPNDEESEVA